MSKKYDSDEKTSRKPLRSNLVNVVCLILWLFLLTGIFAGCRGSGGNRETAWHISIDVESRDMNNNVTHIKQDFYWKPKANILAGVRDENNDIKGEDEVAESGYKLVSGDFITTKTVIVSKVSDITIWYIFTPGWENALEGRVKVITSKGHPWPNYGDYRIYAPEEFLEDKNPVQYIMEKDSPEDGIPVGLIGPLTQEGNFISDDYLNGVLCYLKEINKQGGINGRKLSYFVESADSENNEAIEESLLNLLNEKNICVLAGGGWPRTKGKDSEIKNSLYNSHQL